MLSLTKKSEYALVAICHLANSAEKVVSARDIAEQHLVPLPLLMNVLKSLNQRELISSVRGARGGYRLAVDPAAVTLAAVIEAIEGPVRLVPCAPGTGGEHRACERMHMCTLRRPLHRVHEAFREFLSCVTIADLAFDDQNNTGGASAPACKVAAQ